MSKFEVGSIATGAGSVTLPFASLYGTAGSKQRIVEIGIFNTTTTACAIKLVRLSTIGTRGTAITPGATDQSDPATVQATAYQAHSVAPTFTDIGRRAQIGAAIGAGIIWTWNDNELTIAAASVNAGIGLIGDGGTPQILDWYIKWYE
jgi:hypothetical protein